MVRCGGAMRPPCMVPGVMLVAVVVVVSPRLGVPYGTPPAQPGQQWATPTGHDKHPVPMVSGVIVVCCPGLFRVPT